MISEETLTKAAAGLAEQLNQMLDRVDDSPLPPTPQSSYPLCERSNLDFLSIRRRSMSIPITADVSRRDPLRFRRHLEVCECCGFAEECLDIAERTGEKIGIWGGKLPHERE